MTPVSPPDAPEACRISFEGDEIAAVPGETVAAALIAHGYLQQSSGRDGSPRGHFCGMGVCHDCLVSIDGEPSIRACMTPVVAGMQVRRQDYARPAAVQPRGHEVKPAVVRNVQVLVVGAGPAGLSAAYIAASGAAEVLVVDERPGPGGQFYKQAYGRARSRHADRQQRAGTALIEKARAAGATIENSTTVIGAERNSDGSLEVSVLTSGGSRRIRPRFLIIATGAYERPILVPGWTLPGVMTTGAAQTLVRSYRVSPGRRVLVAGNGPLNLQVAKELVGLAEEVHVIEAAPPLWRRPIAGLALARSGVDLAWQGISSIAHLRRHGVEIKWGHRLVEVHGRDQVEGASFAPVRTDGKRVDECTQTYAVDAVIMGDGFWPSSELARLIGCKGTFESIERENNGATSVEDVFVVGEAGRFGGAQIALAQGELAGREILRRLGSQPSGSSASAHRTLRRARRFQAALWKLFDASHADLEFAAASTNICRCEAISRATLEDTVAAHGVTDIATLKRLTRAGMGRCQGRYCAPVLREFVKGSQEQSLAPQIPLRPAPISSLAAEKPEWLGHERLMPARCPPHVSEALPIKQTDILVIGAGVVGLSTAYFLSRDGREVAVVDSGYPNSGASGGNAGSLHAQLLSFDHGKKSRAATGAARTLPLQLESIALWQQLQSELGVDLEMRVTGGLMVAEDDADMAFLDAKASVERANGVDCRVIDRAELRAMEPGVSEHLVGGAYCPQEGKINPLVATEALRLAAQKAGATIMARTQVVGISRSANGFEVQTSRGTIRCSRVVNAAGAFAGQVGELAGARVPVFGAPLQMIVTEAVEPLVTSLLAFARRHLTMKQAQNGNVIIGGGWTAGLDAAKSHPRPLMASIEGNLWVARRAVPSLSTVRVIRTWAAMNIDIDGAPIIGEHPAVPGLFNAVTANGYTLGPLMGQLTSELITTGRTARDLSPFGVDRFPSNLEEIRR